MRTSASLLDALQLCRPFTMLAPMVGVLAGAGAAIGASGTALSTALVLRIGMGAVMAGVLNAASNALNQVFDIEVDRINKPKRPLPSGRMSRSFAMSQSLGM